MDQFGKNVKEKAQDFALRCKGIYADLRARQTPLLQKIIDNKKRILTIIVAAAVLAGLGTSSWYLLQWWKFRNDSPAFAAIRKGELAGAGKIGSKVSMAGDLEITLQSVAQGSYRPLELDEQGGRITKNYFGAQIMIYNKGQNKELLVFGLTDDEGGQYDRDKEAEFYVDGMKDFGPAKEIYPKTIREGYLVFSVPKKEGQKMQLVILSETTNKKVVFDIER